MDNLHVNDRLIIPASELGVSFARSSGPGGQNVNKVNSKVTLRWQIRQQPRISNAWRERFLRAYRNRVNLNGEVVISSDRHRDQSRNIDDCRQKLQTMLRAVQHPPKVRKPTRVSLARKRLRVADKRHRGTVKRLRGRPNDE